MNSKKNVKWADSSATARVAVFSAGEIVTHLKYPYFSAVSSVYPQISPNQHPLG